MEMYSYLRCIRQSTQERSKYMAKCKYIVYLHLKMNCCSFNADLNMVAALQQLSFLTHLKLPPAAKNSSLAQIEIFPTESKLMRRYRQREWTPRGKSTSRDTTLERG